MIAILLCQVFVVTAKQNTTTFGLQFPCQQDLDPSPEVPTSVHELRPADIKVVGALGDSVTAAFGAASTNLLNIPIESRGLSWSIGAQRSIEEQVTLPSILKEFNPILVGGSTGNGGASSSNAGFNVAITGAIAEGMNGQARTLISRMKADSRVDFEKDWKVVTLWIGGNDLCAVCNRPERHTPELYAQHIRAALETLYQEMPRVFVNLVSILDVTQLGEMSTPRCDSFPGTIRFTACSCGTSSDPDTKEYVREMSYRYQEATEELARDPRWEQRQDFAVVVQPFFKQTTIPRLDDDSFDDSYFGADCFHFSTKGHAAGAVALWNNMLEPVGGKRLFWTVGEPIECPSYNHPFLFTNKNSGPFRNSTKLN